MFDNATPETPRNRVDTQSSQSSFYATYKLARKLVVLVIWSKDPDAQRPSRGPR